MTVRNNDLQETTVNMVLGLVINYLLTLWMFGVTKEFALGTTAVFFTCSFLRSYAVRKFYRRKECLKKN